MSATQRLLVERGYGLMTIDAVAAEAGVGKPTIYRRYPSKVELAAAALAGLPQLAERPPPGDARSQVLWLLRLFVTLEQQISPWALLGTVLAEEHRNPELLAQLRERVIHPRRHVLRQALERGVERGEVRADLDLETAVDLLTGPVFTRRIAAGRLPSSWPETLVDEAWRVVAPAAG